MRYPVSSAGRYSDVQRPSNVRVVHQRATRPLSETPNARIHTMPRLGTGRQLFGERAIFIEVIPQITISVNLADWLCQASLFGRGKEQAACRRERGRMVAELTAGIMLKALFFMVVIFGPLALVLLAVEKRLKKTVNGAYAAAIIKFIVGLFAVVALTASLIWLWRHRELTWLDWVQAVVIIAIVLGLAQDWQRIRKLSQERRQAKALAEAANDQPSEFRYESEIKR